MTIHIIGMGMAGLSAGFHLTKAGHKVILYEASAKAGGRCASYFDKKLNAVVDNGTHLMLGANTALLDMLKECPTKTPLKALGNTFTFYTKDKERFFIKTNKPLSGLRYIKKVYPLLVQSLMNTLVHKADFLTSIRTAIKCFGKKNGKIYLAYPSLQDSIVLPIQAYLKKNKVQMFFSHRLKSIQENKLVFFNTEIPLDLDDKVILALPYENLRNLYPDTPKIPYETIIGIHYQFYKSLPDNLPFIGFVDAIADWAFVKNNVLSVTISAGNELAKKLSPDELATKVWLELNNILNLSMGLPAYRVIMEKRATLEQTKKCRLKRKKQTLIKDNVFIIGDWTETNLPNTIESAVRSGKNIVKKII